MRCDETVRAIASDEIADAGIVRKAFVWMHLRLCLGCREYAAQMTRLGDAVRASWRIDRDPALESLERKILDPIAPHLDNAPPIDAARRRR